VSLAVARPEFDEESLVAACVRGERDAERMLFRREYARVNATVYRLIGGSRDADDLVQETFIAVFRALPRFRGESKLSTWIDRIAVRVVFAHIRARKRLPVPVESVELEQPTATLDDRAHAREGLRRLYAALARLKPEARLAFSLYAIDGRTIAEVAELTDTAQVTAKLRIWRARREIEKRAANDPILSQFLGAVS
jgi:RNA polymerase sigma-70 factor, ECF subfamily